MLSKHCAKEYMIAPQNGYTQTANFSFFATQRTKKGQRKVLLNNPVCQLLINLLSKDKPFVFKLGSISLPLYISILALKY